MPENIHTRTHICNYLNTFCFILRHCVIILELPLTIITSVAGNWIAVTPMITSIICARTLQPLSSLVTLLVSSQFKPIMTQELTYTIKNYKPIQVFCGRLNILFTADLL